MSDFNFQFDINAFNTFQDNINNYVAQPNFDIKINNILTGKIVLSIVNENTFDFRNYSFLGEINVMYYQPKSPKVFIILNNLSLDIKTHGQCFH